MASELATRAAAARAAITAARKAGKLTGLPTDAKISVTCETYSLGSSINVRITADDEFVFTRGEHGSRNLTAEVKTVGTLLEAILSEHTGHSWGSVAANGGASIGHVNKTGWNGGQD